MSEPIRPADTAKLRGTPYNARLVDRRDMHSQLAVFRVVPDGGVPQFAGGQYTLLGLGTWEPAVDPSGALVGNDGVAPGLIKRAYSFSSPLVDDQGKLWAKEHCPFLEFYVALVHRSSEPMAGLTPRLFALGTGDRLLVGSKVTGRYTLAPVQRTDDVVLAATGTGEAPHNAMAVELLLRGHTGRIVVVTCVRRVTDLGYLAAHRRLQQTYTNYRYLYLTTRESVNVDPAAAVFVGKRYLQNYLASGDLERDAGIQIDPGRTHVFLCGNPAMIGAPRRQADGRLKYPSEIGMAELLAQRGLQVDMRDAPGRVHLETYW